MPRKQISPEEALEASKLLDKIMGIDLDRMEVEKLEALRPVDRLVEELRRDGKLRSGPKGRGLKPKDKRKHSPTCSGKCRGNCGSRHWRVRRRREREYYHAKTRAKRIDGKIKLLSTPEGWYAWVTKKWKGVEHFTLEEWLGVIWPAMDGRVPYFTRYDTGRGYTLDNLLVREDKTGDVIFDGKEYLLRRLGYII